MFAQFLRHVRIFCFMSLSDILELSCQKKSVRCNYDLKVDIMTIYKLETLNCNNFEKTQTALHIHGIYHLTRCDPVSLLELNY